MRRFALLLSLSVLIFAGLPGTAHAVNPPQERGLLITPLRQFLKVDAGKTISSSFIVANLTDKALDVTFNVQQFSVADYSYDYEFNQPQNDWLHLSLAQINLQPQQSRSISYIVTVPSGTAPGGHYYTLFASANLSSQGVNNTIQAADLIYLTVNGSLSHTSKLNSASVQRISFGKTIPYQLQVTNTGNIYYFVYANGQLRGLFTDRTAEPVTHLLMPGKIRSVSGSLPAPTLPGVYKAIFGYKTDTGQVITQSRLIMYIPPWFIAFVLAAVLLFGKLFIRRKTKNEASASKNVDNSFTE